MGLLVSAIYKCLHVVFYDPMNSKSTNAISKLGCLCADLGFFAIFVFLYIADRRPCFAIAQEPNLNLRGCTSKVSQMAENPRIPRKFIHAKIRYVI